MSLELSGSDQNVIYVNFEREAEPDRDDTRCEVERRFTSPLLSDLSKYLVSVTRFSIPCQTCFLNSEIRNALMVTTWDPKAGRPSPACLAINKFQDDYVGDVQEWNAADDYVDDTAHQGVYRGMRKPPLVAEYNDQVTRTAILDEIHNDNVSWINAGPHDQDWESPLELTSRQLYATMNFHYERVFNLY